MILAQYKIQIQKWKQITLKHMGFSVSFSWFNKWVLHANSICSGVFKYLENYLACVGGKKNPKKIQVLVNPIWICVLFKTCISRPLLVINALLNVTSSMVKPPPTALESLLLTTQALATAASLHISRRTALSSRAVRNITTLVTV